MYYYILNPASGGGRINKIQDRLKARLNELGIAGEFVKSIGEGDVAKLAQMGVKKGYKTIVAVGGNGTINEIINSIAKAEVAIGIIPIGHKNELAKTLGIIDWQSACNILAARKIERFSIGKIGKNYFVTSVSIGCETELIMDKSSLPALKKPVSIKKSFFWTSKSKPQKAVLNFSDDYTVETNFYNIQISNSQFSLKKSKEPGQNFLDVLITGKMSYSKSFKSIIGFSHDNKQPDTSFFRTKKLIINTQKPMDVTVDGKVLCKTPVALGVSDRKLKIIVARAGINKKETKN